MNRKDFFKALTSLDVEQVKRYFAIVSEEEDNEDNKNYIDAVGDMKWITKGLEHNFSQNVSSETMRQLCECVLLMLPGYTRKPNNYDSPLDKLLDEALKWLQVVENAEKRKVLLEKFSDTVLRWYTEKPELLFEKSTSFLLNFYAYLPNFYTTMESIRLTLKNPESALIAIAYQASKPPIEILCLSRILADHPKILLEKIPHNSDDSEEKDDHAITLIEHLFSAKKITSKFLDEIYDFHIKNKDNVDVANQLMRLAFDNFRPSVVKKLVMDETLVFNKKLIVDGLCAQFNMYFSDLMGYLKGLKKEKKQLELVEMDTTCSDDESADEDLNRVDECRAILKKFEYGNITELLSIFFILIRGDMIKAAEMRFEKSIEFYIKEASQCKKIDALGVCVKIKKIFSALKKLMGLKGEHDQLLLCYGKVSPTFKSADYSGFLQSLYQSLREEYLQQFALNCIRLDIYIDNNRNVESDDSGLDDDVDADSKLADDRFMEISNVSVEWKCSTTIAELRKNLFRPLDKAWLLDYNEYRFYKFLVEMIENIRDTTVHHRKFSGPSEEEWQKSSEATRYFTLMPKDGKQIVMALPVAENKTQVQLALLTSLFYHYRKTNDWNNKACVELREIIGSTHDQLEENDNLEVFEVAHKKMEAKQYYSECPSDNSDDEHYKTFENAPARTRHALVVSAKKMMFFGETDAILYKDHSKFKAPTYPKGTKLENKKLVDPVSVDFYDLESRSVIHHDEQLSLKVHHDLSLLNELYRQNALNKDTIKQIATKFFIAQYRGIHYDTVRWTQRQRKTHREKNERNQALFAEAVYKQCGLAVYEEEASSPENLPLLQRRAALLKHQLNCLRFTGKIESPFTGGEPFEFDQAEYALQDFYTKRYDDHTHACATAAKNKKNKKRISTVADAILLFCVGKENYNLSTGDTPYHPLKYALGIKSYTDEDRKKRLRPRWHRDGRAERPYSGKLYTFLLDPLSYIDHHPRHLVSLAYTGEIKVDRRMLSILPERETTFSVHLEEKHLFEATAIKYPNFDRPFSDYFTHRYGLSRELYEKFRAEICADDSTPHSQKNREAKFLLGEHLCAYYEPCLIEDARLKAQSEGGVLVYHDYLKGFSIVPPPIGPASSGERATAGQAQREARAKRLEEKKGAEASRDLEKMMKNFDIIACESVEECLNYYGLLNHQPMTDQDMLVEEIEMTADNQILQDYFKPEVLPSMVGVVLEEYTNAISRFEKIAREKDIRFIIKSFLFTKDKVVGRSDKKECQLIYFGGDGFYPLLKKSEQLLSQHSPKIFPPKRKAIVQENQPRPQKRIALKNTV